MYFAARQGARRERCGCIVTDRATKSGRQKTVRRSAVGRRRRLGASSVLAGLPGPPFDPLLPSRLLRPITTTSDTDSGTSGAAALVKTLRTICCTALPLLMSLPGAAWAQDTVPPAGDPASEAPDFIGFSADQLSYDENADTVTASGEVRLNRQGYHLRADRVVWDRVSGEVRAEGNVRVDSPEGDVGLWRQRPARGESARRNRREPVARARGWRPAGRGRGAAREWPDDPESGRLHALRGGRRGRMPARPDLADQRRPRGARSGAATASPTRARASTCSARRSSPCPACPIPTAARAAAAACSSPTSASTAATASSSARLIISGSGRTATRRSRRTSIPRCCRCSRPNIGS